MQKNIVAIATSFKIALSATPVNIKLQLPPKRGIMQIKQRMGEFCDVQY